MQNNSTWKVFSKYVNSLIIDKNIVKREIHSELEESHYFYLNIFSWFKPAFSELDEDVIQKLSLAGYTYFRTALLFDKIIDDPDVDTNQTVQILMLGLSYHEHAIKELTKLFPDNENFWKEFEKIKREYSEANLFEKKVSKERKGLTESQFERIAKGKSYLCTASVLSLCSITNDFTSYQVLKESLLSLHVGYQLFDDIDDFRRDLIENQKTYAISKVDEFIKKQIRQDGEITIKEKIKYLYISGIAEELLQAAKHYFEDSLIKIENLPVENYKRLIRDEIKKCEKLIWEIQQTLNKTTVKAGRSHEYKTLVKKNIIAQVNDSLGEGVLFLKSTLENNFLWSDFLTNAGVSNGWVTNYIGYQLSEADLASDVLLKVADAIKDTKISPGAFNNSMIRDGDSMAFGVGLLNNCLPESAEKLASSWVSYQNSEGGWVTYSDPALLKTRLELSETISVAGWTSSHPCVSAAAALILKKMPAHQSIYQKTLRYLKKIQSKNGCVKSYWWTSHVYATSYSILAFSDDSEWVKVKNRSVDWLIKQQTKDGYWDAGYETGCGNAFYTALALKALLPNDDYQDEIERGIRWLLGNQMSDGSWKTQRILKIPSPEVRDPASVKKWRRSSFGVNVIIDDHFRNFTTATVCNTLADYQKMKHKIENLQK